jgi:hypothetical protein
VDVIGNDVKPCVVRALEVYDYDVRCAALKLVGCSDNEINAAIDGVLASPRVREALILLGHMAFAGLLEYYGGWDAESAQWTLDRERSVAHDLAHVEAELLPDHERVTTLKAELKAELAQREAEIRAAWEAGTPPPQARRPKLPPGSRPSYAAMRAIAIMRQRDAEEQ